MRHSNPTPNPDNSEQLAAMNKQQRSGGQRSDQRQDRCQQCGGWHSTKKCRFHGTCYKCNKVGHKQENCNSKVNGDAPLAKIQAMKAFQLPKAAADQSVIRQDFMSKSSNIFIWALASASEEHTTPHKELLRNLSRVDDHRGYIMAGGNIFVPQLKGQVEMLLWDRDGNTAVFQLNDLHYLPGSPCNFMSAGILRKNISTTLPTCNSTSEMKWILCTSIDRSTML